VSADDHRLIAECLQGDTAAFGVLVRRYQERLYNTAYRLVGNAEDAYDVVQEAFLSAYQSLDSFKGDSLFFTWLYRIAVNTAISLKRKRRAVVSIDGGRNGEQGVEAADTSESSHPGHAMEQAEQGRRIHEALGRLSAEHRASRAVAGATISGAAALALLGWQIRRRRAAERMAGTRGA